MVLILESFGNLLKILQFSAAKGHIEPKARHNYSTKTIKYTMPQLLKRSIFMSIFLGITGTCGTVLAKRAIDVLSDKCNLFVSATEQGERHFFEECGVELYDFLRRKQQIVKCNNKHFPAEVLDTVDCVLLLPCSAAEIGKLAAGSSDSLIARVSDRMLAERKRLVLCVGEPILSAVTLKNLEQLAFLGATVCPLVTRFSKHRSVDRMYDAVLEQLLKFCGIEAEI